MSIPMFRDHGEEKEQARLGRCEQLRQGSALKERYQARK